jgi:hypothetical protein
MIVALGITCLGLLAVLLRDDLTLDLVNRRYRRRFGYFPCPKVTEGPATDIKHIFIRYEKKNPSNGDSVSDSPSLPYMQMCAGLVWQQAEQSGYDFYEPRDKFDVRKMLALCSKLSRVLDIPIVDTIDGERTIAPGEPYPNEGAAVAKIRFGELSILKKIVAVESGATHSLSLPENQRFDRLVSSRKPFGLETTFKGKNAKGAGDVKVYQNGGTGYVSRSAISTGTYLIDKWKVYVGRAAPETGNRDTYPHRIISTPFLGEPETIASETYLCIGPFDSKCQAESVLSYLSCRLTRLLILLQPSQDGTRKDYSFVPTQEWTRRWTDEDLYAKYGISRSEIAFIESFIESMVGPMEGSDE